MAAVAAVVRTVGRTAFLLQGAGRGAAAVGGSGDGDGVGVIACLGAALSTALAYPVYLRILAVAGATNLMLVTFRLPISALLLGGFFLGETVSWQAMAGMALIGLGLAAIDGRPWAALRRPTVVIGRGGLIGFRSGMVSP